MQYNIDDLILLALREDMPSEDISTNSVIKQYTLGKADLICKQDGTIAGLDVFKRVFEMFDKKMEFEFYYKDGDDVKNSENNPNAYGKSQPPQDSFSNGYCRVSLKCDPGYHCGA